MPQSVSRFGRPFRYVAKRGILILDMLKVRWRFPTTYHNMATTWYNILHHGNNVATTWHNVVQNSTTWLQRSRNVTEREQNARPTLCYVSAALWYVITIHCGTRCCMAAARHSEAQRGDSVTIVGRQRGITRVLSSQRDYNEATT